MQGKYLRAKVWSASPPRALLVRVAFLEEEEEAWTEGGQRHVWQAKMGGGTRKPGTPHSPQASTRPRKLTFL